MTILADIILYGVLLYITLSIAVYVFFTIFDGEQ